MRLYDLSRTGKSTETKSVFPVARGCREMGVGGTAKRYRVSLDDGNALQFDCCDGFTIVNGLKPIKPHTSKRMGCFDV